MTHHVVVVIVGAVIVVGIFVVVPALYALVARIVERRRR